MFQRAVYECSAKCCSNSKISTHELKQCIINCHEKLNETRRDTTDVLQKYKVRNN